MPLMGKITKLPWLSSLIKVISSKEYPFIYFIHETKIPKLNVD